jgi:hypothetical protein
MKNLFAIGDVHGHFTSDGNEPSYRSVINELNGDTIQVGDFGIFDGSDTEKLRRKVKPRDGYTDVFFRGNHDNPDLCAKHPNNLGDFGEVPDYHNMFFIAGAESCDRSRRTEGKDWWPDEQLSYGQMEECQSLYEKIRPEIVLTHDCPTLGYFYVHPHSLKNHQNPTASFLQKLFEIHSPLLWIHGHHHQSKTYFHNETKFRSLGELEPYLVRID